MDQTCTSYILMNPSFCWITTGLFWTGSSTLLSTSWLKGCNCGDLVLIRCAEISIRFRWALWLTSAQRRNAKDRVLGNQHSHAGHVWVSGVWWVDLRTADRACVCGGGWGGCIVQWQYHALWTATVSCKVCFCLQWNISSDLTDDLCSAVSGLKQQRRWRSYHHGTQRQGQEPTALFTQA